MSVRKYRKKPVVIEAMLFYGSNYNDVVRWIMNDDRENEKPKDEVTIQTLEGVMTARIGDYVIKGVNGEFYPCKPDIFSKTYEEII